MVIRKSKIVPKLLFLFLVVFPFGQLARIYIPIIDVIFGLFIILFFFGRYPLPSVAKQLLLFATVGLFSLLFSLSIFNLNESLTGFLYLLRLFGVFAFFVVIYWELKNKEKSKVLTLNSLLLVSLAVALVGWIQYLFLPDLRALTAWGWDDHLYRLAGTFLDPGFTSIILVFGYIVSLAKGKRLATSFLFLSVLFTYARGGYLALIISSIYLLRSRPKILIGVIAAFVIGILLLPRPAGEGVKLTRTYSIFARGVNYQEGFEIFKKSPVFGVGLNNICIAKSKYLGHIDTDSHACSGLDSSLLLVLATTGVVGLTVFLNFILHIRVTNNIYGKVFVASGIALLVQSLFINSIFYPWVLGWMAILLALSVKEYKSQR